MEESTYSRNGQIQGATKMKGILFSFDLAFKQPSTALSCSTAPLAARSGHNSSQIALVPPERRSIDGTSILGHLQYSLIRGLRRGPEKWRQVVLTSLGRGIRDIAEIFSPYCNCLLFERDASKDTVSDGFTFVPAGADGIPIRPSTS